MILLVLVAISISIILITVRPLLSVPLFLKPKLSKPNIMKYSRVRLLLFGPHLSVVFETKI